MLYLSPKTIEHKKSGYYGFVKMYATGRNRRGSPFRVYAYLRSTSLSPSVCLSRICSDINRLMHTDGRTGRQSLYQL